MDQTWEHAKSSKFITIKSKAEEKIEDRYMGHRLNFKKLEDVISQTFRAPLVMDLPISIYIMWFWYWEHIKSLQYKIISKINSTCSELIFKFRANAKWDHDNYCEVNWLSLLTWNALQKHIHLFNICLASFDCSNNTYIYSKRSYDRNTWSDLTYFH